jgi:hypothetical protein
MNTLELSDLVYTPNNVALDMIQYFKPSGRILDPCSGKGAFLRYLPGADWCEITEGRSFFECTQHYDWIVGNPPYSMFAPWLRHSFTLAENILYLLPAIRCWISTKIIKDIKLYGGIRTIAVYPNNLFNEWSIGFAICAIHFQRNYKGKIEVIQRAISPEPNP